MDTFNKYLPQILIGLGIVLSFIGGLISFKRDSRDSTTSLNLATSNESLAKENKGLAQENKALAEENIKWTTENMNLSDKIYTLSTQISELSQLNINLSKELYSKVQEEALKNSKSESLTFYEDKPIPQNVTFKFGNGITYSCPKERLEIGFSIMDFLVAGPTRFGSYNIKLQDGKLLLNAKVVDFDDKVVGNVVDNVWEVNSNTSFTRRFNSKALEIVDNYNIPVLQFKIVSNDEIYIGGVFHYDNSVLILSQETEVRPVKFPVSKNNANSEMRQQLFNMFMNEARKIKSIFP